MRDSKFSVLIKESQTQTYRINEAIEYLRQLEFDAISKLLILRENILEKWRAILRLPKGSTYVEDTGDSGGLYYGVWAKDPSADRREIESLLLGRSRDVFVFFDVTPIDRDGMNGFRGELRRTLALPDESDIPRMNRPQVDDLLEIAEFFNNLSS